MGVFGRTNLAVGDFLDAPPTANWLWRWQLFFRGQWEVCQRRVDVETFTVRGDDLEESTLILQQAQRVVDVNRFIQLQHNEPKGSVGVGQESSGLTTTN